MTDGPTPAASARDVVAKGIHQGFEGSELFGVGPTNGHVADAILAALDAANLTIVERGMVTISLEDANMIERAMWPVDKMVNGRRKRDALYAAGCRLQDAIARAGSGPGDGEGNR